MHNSLLSRFTPKEPKFFEFIKEVSEISKAAANLLQQTLNTTSTEERQNYFDQLKKKEHEADVLSHKIFEALESTFITPYDREDVHELSNRLDDVIDLIYSCTKRIVIYQPNQMHSSSKDLAKIIVEGTEKIDEAIGLLPNMRKSIATVKGLIEDLHILENKADDIFEDAITDIFANEPNAIELMKNKEIISIMEKATDAAEHVGKILKTIIVKYA